jgi:hypothetical protein
VKSSESFIEAFVYVALTVAIPSGLWFCIDDTCAVVLGAPWVGGFDFWDVYALGWFVVTMAGLLRMCLGKGKRGGDQ